MQLCLSIFPLQLLSFVSYLQRPSHHLKVVKLFLQVLFWYTKTPLCSWTRGPKRCHLGGGVGVPVLKMRISCQSLVVLYLNSFLMGDTL